MILLTNIPVPACDSESMEAGNGVKLQVFVKKNCRICSRARQLATQADEQFPNLEVAIVDINEAQPDRDDVFAVPTFVLDGRVLSLGNPQASELHEEVALLLSERGLV